MSRLRLVAFSTLAKVAEAKGFYRIWQEGVTIFFAVPMERSLLFPIMVHR